MGRFYKTTTTPTVDYSAKFPFEELFQAYKYQQERNDAAMDKLATGWDNLLKVGYLPGGADEEYVKNARAQFENLYRAASEKGNLSNNYNWLQREISLIGKDPHLIDIHRSYLGGQKKLENDQALKTAGQYKDYLATDSYGWDTKTNSIFGSDPSHYTTPWLDWKPVAKSYFDNMEDPTKTGEEGWRYISQHAANNASDFANKPEGKFAIDEAIREGTLTQGLDPNDPNFRNNIAQRILENEAMEIWKRPEVETKEEKNNKNNKNLNKDPYLVETINTKNPYVTLLEDIYRPEYTGQVSPFTGKPNMNMVNGAQLNQEQVDDLLGIDKRVVTDDNDNIVNVYRPITLGKDVYLDVSGFGGPNSYYSWDQKTGTTTLIEDSSQSASARERQAYDIALLTQFYENGYIQEQMEALEDDWVIEINTNTELKNLADLNPYLKVKWKLEQLREKGDQAQIQEARQLLINNGIDPFLDQNISLYETHKALVNEKGETEGTWDIVKNLQHNMRGLDGVTVEFEVNDSDKNVFMTSGFNADGSPSNRLAVRGYAIVTEDQLEAAFDQKAYGLRFNDWKDQLVDRAGVIKLHNADGDDSTYKVPLYIPIDMTHSRMENYNQGKISSAEGSDEKELFRQQQFNRMVDFNVQGNVGMLQNRSLQKMQLNNERQMSALANMPFSEDAEENEQIKGLFDGLEQKISAFENKTVRNKAENELDEIREAINMHREGPAAVTGAFKAEELLEKYPTLGHAVEGYSMLATKLRDKSWNYRDLDSKNIEQNYRVSMLGTGTDVFNPTDGSVTNEAGEEYIKIKPGSFNVVSNPTVYREVASLEAGIKGLVDISDPGGDNSPISSTNVTIKGTAYSPHLTAMSAQSFDELLKIAAKNDISVTLTGAHRTQAYNDALASNLGIKSRGFHVKGQAVDLAPSAAMMKLLTQLTKEQKQSLGIYHFAEEGKGTKNHHIHIEFMR